MIFSITLACASMSWLIQATSVESQTAIKCKDYDYPRILCMQRYGSLLPPQFNRTVKAVVGETDTYGSTQVPGDPSFSLVADADFLVWDMELAEEVLGSDPQVDFMFKLSSTGHEGPVYAPTTNAIYFSALVPSVESQAVIHLDTEPPKPGTSLTSPPVVAPAGATWYKGGILWAGSAVKESDPYTPGLYFQNVTTGKITPLMNNYFGYRFTTLDDLDVAPNGDVWFTHNWYALAATPGSPFPPLEPAIFRFVPSTGAVEIVDDTFQSPNGLHFSPDGSVVYITDGSADFVHIPSGKITYDSYKRRTVYACKLSPDQRGIEDKRAIYLSQDRLPDGLKVAQNGYIATATGHGIDILTPLGQPIVRVQTNFTVLNLAFAGPEYDQLWLVGFEGSARIKWNLKGMKQTS